MRISASERPFGLSPRVRGSLVRPGLPQVAYGIIPACAGEPVRQAYGPCSSGDYPRVCGGASR